jgi:hypothetical protein
MAKVSWAEMNQYQRADARMLVDGYRVSQRHSETREEWFERAKAECLDALDKRRAQVECMTFDQMFPPRPAGLHPASTRPPRSRTDP